MRKKDMNVLKKMEKRGENGRLRKISFMKKGIGYIYVRREKEEERMEIMEESRWVWESGKWQAVKAGMGGVIARLDGGKLNVGKITD